jgi:hypothetical protein
MCRNIKPLFNFDPPATEEEIHNASLQFIRKISGFQKPSFVNEKVFAKAVEDVSKVTADLLKTLETDAPYKNREEEAKKRKEKSEKRFGNTS